MKKLVSRFGVAVIVFSCAMSSRVTAQVVREPEGGALPAYAKVLRPHDDREPGGLVIRSDNGLPNIMLTGYWPPTNEMLRRFSTNLNQNPDGWVGENWEERGYNIYSFFPEFPGGLGQGVGDFEVDYQDTSNDWWLIIAEIQPVANITFGRADIDFDWELEGGHHMYPLDEWMEDYRFPYLPTPELPIADETPGTDRWSTLPIEAIVDAVEARVPNVYAYSMPVDDSSFLCNFIGYHANWYHDLHADPEDPAWNVAAGHIHVGSQIELEDAIHATEVTVRTLAEYLDSQLPVTGDFDDDRDVDAADRDAFAVCFTGPDGGPLDSGCEPGDFDHDGDIDCPDWYGFVDAWTEPEEPPALAQCPVLAPLPAPHPHDARKNRYVSFDPNNSGLSVAFQIELRQSAEFGDSAGILGWVGESDVNGLSRVEGDPYFSDTWPEVVHVGDCEIVPVATYRIRSTSDAALLTNPFEVGTILKPVVRYYGNTVGVGTGDLPPLPGFTPPNGVVNVTDIQAYILTFQGASSPSTHTTWVDLHGDGDGCPPNFVLNVADLQRIKFGFQGQRYADAPDQVDPADCP